MTAAPRRFGTCIRLRPEHRKRYLTLHEAVPAAVETALRAANVTNYSIHLGEDLLFGYYEYTGADHEADLARIAADPATRQWWTLTDPCQQRLPGTPDGQQWAPLREVWHLAP